VAWQTATSKLISFLFNLMISGVTELVVIWLLQKRAIFSGKSMPLRNLVLVGLSACPRGILNRFDGQRYASATVFFQPLFFGLISSSPSPSPLLLSPVRPRPQRAQLIIEAMLVRPAHAENLVPKTAQRFMSLG